MTYKNEVGLWLNHLKPMEDSFFETHSLVLIILSLISQKYSWSFMASSAPIRASLSRVYELWNSLHDPTLYQLFASQSKTHTKTCQGPGFWQCLNNQKIFKFLYQRYRWPGSEINICFVNNNDFVIILFKYFSYAWSGRALPVGAFGFASIIPSFSVKNSSTGTLNSSSRESTCSLRKTSRNKPHKSYRLYPEK